MNETDWTVGKHIHYKVLSSVANQGWIQILERGGFVSAHRADSRHEVPRGGGYKRGPPPPVGGVRGASPGKFLKNWNKMVQSGTFSAIFFNNDT